MKGKPLVKGVVIAIFATNIVFMVQAVGKDDIAKVRDATAQFQSTPAARVAGYELVIGLDYCFQNYGVGGMGYHYINTSLLDTTVDLLHPEALVYVPDPNGSLHFGAVEYMVPAAAWDAEYTELPQVLGHRLHLNEKLGMYVLHAWIWKNNPSGMFEDWNRDIACPAPLQWKGPNNWR